MSRFPEAAQAQPIKETIPQKDITPQQLLEQAEESERLCHNKTAHPETIKTEGRRASLYYSRALHGSLSILMELNPRRLSGELSEGEAEIFSDNMTTARSARTGYTNVKSFLEEEGCFVEDDSFARADLLLRQIEAE